MSDSARTIAAGRASAVLPREEPGVVPGSDARLGAGSRDVSGAAPSALGAHPVGDRASDSLRRLRRTVWPSGPRADLGWPRGLALHPHGLGQHPRPNARKRTRTGHPLQRSSTVEVRGRYLGWPPVIKNGSASRPLRLHGPALPPVGLRCQAAHDVAPSLARGHAERHRSGPVPSRPSSSTLAPSPLEGPGPWLMPGTWDRQTRRQLRRTTQLRVDASWPGDLGRPGLRR
jgi:hypothetical protein